MHIYVKRGNSICLTEPDDLEDNEWTRVILSANASPIIVTLSDDVILVKYQNRNDGVLIVFPYNVKRKPRILKLHGLPNVTSVRELTHAVFALLLDFDDGRLSNRLRNDTIIIVRALLPDVVTNDLGNKEDGLTFYLRKDKISIRKDKTVVARLDHYILFSRNIKDSIS